MTAFDTEAVLRVLQNVWVGMYAMGKRLKQPADKRMSAFLNWRIPLKRIFRNHRSPLSLLVNDNYLLIWDEP